MNRIKCVPTWKTLWIFFTAMIVGIFLFFLLPTITYKSSTEQRIVSAIEDCYTTTNQNACYAKIALQFAKRFQISTVLHAIAKYEKQPHIFQVCHEVLHFFGRAIFNRINNISKALSSGDSTCFAGYYHGALEGYFLENDLLGSEDGASLAVKLSSLCQQGNTVRTRKDANECLHGLGHALMFATDSELPRALKLCDIFPKDQATWCYSGVFMENSTSATNKDHPSKYFKKDDPSYPCSILNERYLSMCYALQTQYIVEQSGGDWKQAFAFCQKIPSTYRKNCAMATGGSIAQYNQDPYIIKDSCEQAAEYDDQAACTIGAVNALGEKYKDPFEHVVPFCSILDAHKAICYQQINNLMQNWTQDTKILQGGCRAIPEISYRTACLQTVESIL